MPRLERVFSNCFAAASSARKALTDLRLNSSIAAALAKRATLFANLLNDDSACLMLLVPVNCVMMSIKTLEVLVATMQPV